MASFVLVHGAWHGAWCWERVVPLLEGAGHRVAAPDLPGHGLDRTPAREATLEACAERIRALLAAQSSRVVLVARNLGGIVASQAAERCPERIDLPVYLAAFLLPLGRWRVSWGQSAPEMAASLTPVTQATAIDRDAGEIAVNPRAARELFSGGCSPEDALRATARLRPEPLSMDTSHSPFLSEPKALAAHLIELSRSRV